MKDGSNLIDRFLTDSAYVKYSFTHKKVCTNGNPTHKVNQTCFDYTLNNNFIKTSSTSGYFVESIKKDTLILCEKIDGFKNDKLKRFYFVKKKSLFSSIKAQKAQSKNQNRKYILHSNVKIQFRA